MRLRNQLAITSLLAVGLAAGWVWLAGTQDAGGSARGGHGRATGGGATRVLVEALEKARDRVVVRAVGTGVALKSAEIHPAVAGEVIEVRFTAGQRVKKGAMLVRLDDEHQHLEVRLTEVALRKARREVERLNKLASSGHASRARVENAQADLESASVRLAQARAALADRTVIAPFDGIIGLSDVSLGDRVTENTMIATLDDRSAILVDFNLPEAYVSRIRVGDPITVRTSTMPDRAIAGTIAATGSRIDPKSRSLRVRARITNAEDRIRPGASFVVELAFVGRLFPRVREVAVLWSRDGAYLWRVSGGKAEKVFVKLVRRGKGRILVDGPLDPGDMIVVEGVQGLRSGQVLDPAQYDPDGNQQAAPGTARRRAK